MLIAQLNDFQIMNTWAFRNFNEYKTIKSVCQHFQLLEWLHYRQCLRKLKTDAVIIVTVSATTILLESTWMSLTHQDMLLRFFSPMNSKPFSTIIWVFLNVHLLLPRSQQWCLQGGSRQPLLHSRDCPMWILSSYPSARQPRPRDTEWCHKNNIIFADTEKFRRF